MFSVHWWPHRYVSCNAKLLSFYFSVYSSLCCVSRGVAAAAFLLLVVVVVIHTRLELEKPVNLRLKIKMNGYASSAAKISSQEEVVNGFCQAPPLQRSQY